MPAKLLATGKADETAVRGINCPPVTETWTPIAHGVLLDEVDKAMSELGLTVDPNSRKFGLQHGGMQMFGIYSILDHDNSDMGYGFNIGVRNSMDKSLSAAVVFGSRVFVCDNLCFSGEESIARKHTKFILRDLPVLVRQALQKFETFKLAQEKIYTAMQDVYVDMPKVHDLVVKAMKKEAIPATFIPRVLSEYETPKHSCFTPRNLWSLKNAFTEVMKPSFETNPLVASERTIKLVELFVQEYPQELAV